MRKVILVFILLSSYASAQVKLLESGPMLGYVEHREALLWFSVNENVKKAELAFWKNDQKETSKRIVHDVLVPSAHTPIKFTLSDLDMNTVYEYELKLNDVVQKAEVVQRFRTKDVWDYRRPAPDFSFLFGSCAFQNDSIYDRPGKPYGQSTKIFETMGETNADFNIWGGDNLYFREADISSRSGLLYRHANDRSHPGLKKVLAIRPNYSIWDDHDYGPNDANSTFELKNESRALFAEWWVNRSYGENGDGIYSKFTFSDCDFFLLDNRWFRSPNLLPDSINGKPNPDKEYLGRKQLDWLKNSLMSSNGKVKFIVGGGQFLNKLNNYECYTHFPAELNELLSHISDNKISGVIFLSGDRHHTELLKVENKAGYPLYEFTCSPLTSGTYPMKAGNPELNHPDRIKGSLIDQNNFSRISVKSTKSDRIVSFEVFSGDSKLLYSYSINVGELSSGSKK